MEDRAAWRILEDLARRTGFMHSRKRRWRPRGRDCSRLPE